VVSSSTRRTRLTGGKNPDEPKNAPDLPVGRFLKSMSLSRDRVIGAVGRGNMTCSPVLFFH
jgi:hypothetical protein